MIIHPWKWYANQTLNWLPTDTEELYKQNLKNNFEQLNRYGWVDRHIEYKFNSHGFRCEEFGNSDNAVFLGCSNTAGIGIPIETTWPYLVSQELNLTCYNLGVGGGSNDLAFRISLHYLKILKPKILFLLSPDSARIEILNTNNVISIVPNHREHEFGNYYKLYLSNDDNLSINQQKNILAIKSLCNTYNIKFVCIDDPFAIENNSIDLSRDLMHKGPATNSKLAQRFLSMM